MIYTEKRQMHYECLLHATYTTGDSQSRGWHVTVITHSLFNTSRWYQRRQSPSTPSSPQFSAL